MDLWPTGRGAKRKRASLLAAAATLVLLAVEAAVPGALPPLVGDLLRTLVEPYGS